MTYMIIPYLILTAIAVTLFRVRNVGRRPKGVPPGPPTAWLFGNWFQMPRNNPERALAQWAKEYGPIYSLVVGTGVKIVITDDKIAKELLDKRSSINSSRRPKFITDIVPGNCK